MSRTRNIENKAMADRPVVETKDVTVLGGDQVPADGGGEGGDGGVVAADPPAPDMHEPDEAPVVHSRALLALARNSTFASRRVARNAQARKAS